MLSPCSLWSATILPLHDVTPMSTPQSASTKRTKRPRGLLASRKTTGNPAESEPAAKRARGEDTPPQDPEELKLQDWHDLEELFENAFVIGPNWTSAIPLIRGVLHECARMVTVYNDPTLIYSPLEPETQVGPEKAPAVGGIRVSVIRIISLQERGASPGRAKANESLGCESILHPHSSFSSQLKKYVGIRIQLEFTWGRVLVAAAQSLSDSEDEPRVSENGTTDARAHFLGSDPSAALARAFEHLTYGIDHRPRYTDSDSEAKDEQKSKDERFVRALLESAQGVLATSESLQSEESLPILHLEKCREFLHQVEEMSVPEELRVQVILVLGQINLAIGSSIAEKFEEDSNAEDGTGSEGLETRKVAIGSLKEAVAKFDAVRELCSKQSTEKAESVVEELKPMVGLQYSAQPLQEALVTLATLLPEGPEQERMYSRYQAEGGILDDEDDEDDEE
ncbi:hypothetical protein AG1IA_02238 [Rhizoctonia solani AG-1 IA]|uniref:Uncharacterized protein n=1 Tax=Thanatephorus cucumeris (strain AG1-IA) TaxID=983506 RepID=L8X530_THACA|nr:hypothetical protein AG1IA_02238 [Rhizoctonia solani AG-1 IA]